MATADQLEIISQEKEELQLHPSLIMCATDLSDGDESYENTDVNPNSRRLTEHYIRNEELHEGNNNVLANDPMKPRYVSVPVLSVQFGEENEDDYYLDDELNNEEVKNDFPENEGNHKKTKGKSANYFFDCNICLESVEDPVVTQCGHLYCWKCLYKWFEPGLTANERAQLRMESTTQSLIPTDSTTITTEISSEGARERDSNHVQNEDQSRVRHHELNSSVDLSRRTCPVCKAGCSLLNIVPIYVKTSKTTDSTKEQNSFSAPRRPTPSMLSNATLYNNIIPDSIANAFTPTSSNLIRTPPPLFTSATLSSSFDQSIVPVLLGLREVSDATTTTVINGSSRNIVTPNRISLSRNLSYNSEESPYPRTEEQREYTLMEDVTMEFLSKLLLMMGSTVILILLLF